MTLRLSYRSNRLLYGLLALVLLSRLRTGVRHAGIGHTRVLPAWIWFGRITTQASFDESSFVHDRSRLLHLHLTGARTPLPLSFFGHPLCFLLPGFLVHGWWPDVLRRGELGQRVAVSATTRPLERGCRLRRGNRVLVNRRQNLLRMLVVVPAKHRTETPLAGFLPKAKFRELVPLHLNLIRRVRERNLLDMFRLMLRSCGVFLGHGRRLNIGSVVGGHILALWYLDLRRNVHVPIALGLRVCIFGLTPVCEPLRGFLGRYALWLLDSRRIWTIARSRRKIRDSTTSTC